MQPQKYERTTDFTERDGDDTDHSALNQELDEAALSINQVRENLALIQRDDGALKNGIVTADALDPSAFDAVQASVNAAVNEAESAATAANIAATTANIARDTAVASKNTAVIAAESAQLSANSVINNPNLSVISSDLAGMGFAYDLGSVASQASNVQNSPPGHIVTVADNIAEVNIVSNNVASVTTTAGSIDSVNATAGAIASVNTVAANVANVNITGANIANVNATGGNIANVNTVAGISANVTTVAGVAADVTTVAQTNGIEIVAADLGGVRFTNDFGLITDPVTGPGATAPGAITTVAINIADVQAVAADTANIDAVAGNLTNVNAVVGNAANINTVAGISANVTTVAGNTANINAVAANKANIDTVAVNNTNVTAVATNIASVNNTSANMAAVIDAPNQAAAAAASAATAAASAAAGMYSAVQDKSADYTVVAGDAGDLIRMTTTGGVRAVTLPSIGAVSDGFNVTVVKWTGDANGVTVSASSGELINGSATYVLDAQYKSATFVADKETMGWFASGSGSTSTNIVVDAFSGTGSQTDFTLSGQPGSENNTQVFVGGVYQEKDTYSLSGVTLTFSVAPPAGTSNIEVVWAQPLAIGVPSDSSVNTVKLADNAVTTAKVADAAITSVKLAATLDLGAL